MEIKGSTIVVWFSCSAASAVTAKLVVEKYSKDNTVIVANTFVKEEDEDNRRFLKDVEKWIGQSIIDVRNDERRNDKAEFYSTFGRELGQDDTCEYCKF